MSEYGYFADRERHMSNWDGWMKYIRDGGRGDFPRLGYETIIDAGQALESEISDLREKLRISQENVKFLQMQFFLVDGKIDEATEALGSALAGGKASEAISQPPE